MNSKTKTAILGAGISGLSCAWWIQKKQPGTIHIYDKAPRTGGKIDSLVKQGFVLENGPHVLLNGRPTTASLLQEVPWPAGPITAKPTGMTNYLYRQGGLQKYPSSAGEFIFRNPMSMAGLLRLIKEPLISGNLKDEDESAADFCHRRFGREFTEVFIDPLLNGIYATTPGQASIKSVLPKYFYAEKLSGSVFKNFMSQFIRQAGTGLPGALQADKTLSFKGGLKEFARGLESDLKNSGAEIFTGENITSIQRRDNSYNLQTQNTRQSYDAVISCLPAPGLAPLIKTLSPRAAEMASRINYVPLAVIYLAYKTSQVKHVPGGFGFLLPSGEKKKTNGCVYLSRVFDHKAPAGSELFSLQMGGAGYPNVIDLNDEELIDLAVGEMREMLKIKEAPWFTHIIRHWEALPVFGVGHADNVTQIEEVLKTELPGFILAGSGFYGTGIEKCIENSRRSAEKWHLFSQSRS